MKTILERLELLPEPYREKAIYNYTTFGPSPSLYRDDGSIEMAIHLAFSWSKTQEGHLFWQRLEKLYCRINGTKPYCS